MAEDKVPTSRPRRLWQIVLVISLALNLAVVGLVVGSAASGRLGKEPPRSFDLGLGPVSRALNQDERREIGRSLRQGRALRDFDLRGRVTDMVTALTAEPFDPDALRMVMEEQSTRMADIQSKAQAAFITQIIAMSPDRRRSFADQLTQELSRERGPRKRESGG